MSAHIKSDRSRIGRRQFLLAGSAVVTSVVPLAAEAAPDGPPASDRPDAQYEETAHVRDYYARARF